MKKIGMLKCVPDSKHVTVSDILSADNVNTILDELANTRADIVEVVVITVNREGTVEACSSTTDAETVYMLEKAKYNYLDDNKSDMEQLG